MYFWGIPLQPSTLTSYLFMSAGPHTASEWEDFGVNECGCPGGY